MLIKNFTGIHEFLSLDVPCDIEFNGMIFPTVRHAMIAAKTTDRSLHSLIVDSDLETAKVLEKEVFPHEVDADIYSDKLVRIILEKYKNQNFYNQLLQLIDENDVIDYGDDDFNRILANSTMFIKKYGLNYNKIIEELLCM